MANERTVSRQEWWIAFGSWAAGNEPGPICIECADPMPDADLTGHILCEECEDLAASSTDESEET
jgi:hypothetical protein